MEQAVVHVARPPGDVTITPKKLPCDLWPDGVCLRMLSCPSLEILDLLWDAPRPRFKLLEDPRG